MALHRSDRPAPWWRRWLPDRVRQLTADVPPRLDLNHITLTWSDPFTLDAGHPLCQVPCLLCEDLPGLQPVRQVALILPAVSHVRAWGVESAAFLICARHGIPDADEISSVIHRREHPDCVTYHHRSPAKLRVAGQHETRGQRQ
jgi:hypothetical protein